VKIVWEVWKKGYTKEKIYNADKSGLFYNTNLDKAFRFKEEKCGSGKKFKTLTMLLCANVCGKDKKLLVTG
jgi:hypothetical protein